MKKQNFAGFTLTELMFAMAFLGFLLLFVVNAMMQFMASYNQGLTYKAINQTGRIIFEDVTRGIRTSGEDSTDIRNMRNGRLCVSGQTYIWNSEETNHVNRYEGAGPGQPGTEILGVIRVPDNSGGLCSENPLRPLARSYKDEQTVLAPARVSVQVFSASAAGNSTLYKLNLVLSTSDESALETTGGNATCKGGREGEFCAVAKFETVIATRR